MEIGKRKIAIVGAAESDLGHTPDKTFLQLIAQATMRSLDDAGLSKSDIDGLFSAGWLTMESMMVAGHGRDDQRDTDEAPPSEHKRRIRFD